jgi:nicotinamide-nucleotide amidase
MYMLRTNEIHALAERLVALLDERSLTIATAESCTGGAVSQALTSVAGCSSVMHGAVVAYHNDVKSAVLGVSAETLVAVGAVSEDVVCQMVCGVARLVMADCAIATSGIAGPGGGTAEKPVGTVWVAVKAGDVVKAKKLQLCDAGRLQNVANATYEALRFMYETLLEVK